MVSIKNSMVTISPVSRLRRFIGASQPSVGRSGLGSAEHRARSSRTAEGKRRRVIFDGVKIEAPVFDGAELAPAMTVPGPAIVEEPTTTVVIPPRWELAVNRFGDYEMSFGAEST